MKKNKNQDNSSKDEQAQDKQKELEARIDDMLQVSAEERKALRGETVIKIHDDKTDTNDTPIEAGAEDLVDGVPALPVIEKKKTKIAITHDDESSEKSEAKGRGDDADEQDGIDITTNDDDEANSLTPEKPAKKAVERNKIEDASGENAEDASNSEEDAANEDEDTSLPSGDSTPSKAKKKTKKALKNSDVVESEAVEPEEDEDFDSATQEESSSIPAEDDQNGGQAAEDDDETHVSEEEAPKKTVKKAKTKKIASTTEDKDEPDEAEDPVATAPALNATTDADNNDDEQADNTEDSDEVSESENDDELSKAIAAANEQLARRRERSMSAAKVQKDPTPEDALKSKKILDIKPSNESPHDDADELAGEQESDDANLLGTKKPVTLQPNVKPGMVNIIAQHIPTQPTSTEKVLEDGTTDKVVEQIIATEGDTLLEADDEKKAGKFAPPQKKKRSWFITSLFKKKKFWLGSVLLLVIGLGVCFALPQSRYALLNTAGVRSGLSLKVIDQKSLQPLRGVKISIAGVESETDKSGEVSFENLRLGDANLTIKKRAFAEITKPVVVGWGSNPLGEQQLTPTGSQYVFIVRDFLSDQPIASVEASSGEYSAQSDEGGKIVLTIDEPEIKTLDVQVTGDSLRTENVVLDLDDQTSEREVLMAPGRKQLFVSNRSGTYDLYSIDADGQNETKILPGTGSERDDITILHHPTKEYAAFVSTRDNKRNNDGFLLSTLTVIDTTNKTNRSVVSSERIQIVGWAEDQLVYVRVSEGSSASNPQRNRLVSYDVEEGIATELATANYFNSVTLIDEKIYFAPSGTYAAQDQIGLFRIDADGSSKQRIYNKEVWNMFRLSYDTLTLAAQQDWLAYKLDGQSPPGSISEPANKKSRVYTENPSGLAQLWVDNRDGKGVLLVGNYENNEEKILQTASGLRSPVRWLNDTTLVYRVVTGVETADYVMSTRGGEARKITDVTNTNNPDSWYYY